MNQDLQQILGGEQLRDVRKTVDQLSLDALSVDQAEQLVCKAVDQLQLVLSELRELKERELRLSLNFPEHGLPGELITTADRITIRLPVPDGYFRQLDFGITEPPTSPWLVQQTDGFYWLKPSARPALLIDDHS